jgi:hypothetical protein
MFFNSLVEGISDCSKCLKCAILLAMTRKITVTIAILFLVLEAISIIVSENLPYTVWHDALMLVGGIFLGSLAGLIVLLLSRGESNAEHKVN